MLRHLTLVTFIATLASPLAGQTAPPLEGVWRVVAVTGPDGKTTGAPEPGLYIFTRRHYSIQRVTEPRAALPADASEKERLASYDPYLANTGTYTIEAGVLVTRVLASKSPRPMAGPPQRAELKFEGRDVIFVTSSIAGGPNTTVKLQRVE